MGVTIIPVSATDSLASVMLFDPKSLRVLRVFRLVRVVRLLKGLSKFQRVQRVAHLVDTLQNCFRGVIHVFALWLISTVSFALMGSAFFGETSNTAGVVLLGNETSNTTGDVLLGNETSNTAGDVLLGNKYGALGEHAHFNAFGPAMVTMFKVATLDGWCWVMRDVMAAQSRRGEYASAWVFFITYLVVTAFLFLNIFTAIVLDQYNFTARVTTKPDSNGLARQILTFHQASTISEEWSYLDPQKTDFLDASRVRQLLFNIGPPVGFAPNLHKARQLRHLRRMELRMTGRAQQVHYVDFFLSCAVLRYRLQRKPMGELDLHKVRGKLSLKVALGFPTVGDPRLADTGGLLSAVQALHFLQGQYRGLVLRRMRANGDLEGIVNFDANRATQVAQQEERRMLEAAEEAALAARAKVAVKDKKKANKKKK